MSTQFPIIRPFVDARGRIDQAWLRALQEAVSGEVTFGLEADLPVPAVGAVYLATDTGLIYVSDGTGWTQFVVSATEGGVLTGDVTKPANSTETTLASVMTPGTFGSSSLTPVITVDEKGRITALSFEAIVAAATPGGTNGQLQYNGSGTLAGAAITYSPTTQGLSFANPQPTRENLSPLTTKGDVFVRSSTESTRLAVGTNNQALIANSAEATGLQWQDIVNSLSGTPNRITLSSSTGTPSVDIASTYVGQTSITTLGTIGTGTWQGTPIAIAYGGTGLTALGTSKQVLRTNVGATGLEYASLIASDVAYDSTGLQAIPGSTVQAAFSSVNNALVDEASTGILYGGAVTGIGSATVSITGGEGTIANNTTPSSPTFTNVTWSAASGLTPPSGVSYYYVDATGTITNTTTAPTASQRRTRIYLALVSVSGGLVTGITSIVTPTQNIGPNIRDLTLAIGPIRINGLAVSAGGANLTLQVSAGSLFYGDSNFQADATNPNQTSIAAKTAPATFRMVTQNGPIATDVTTVPVGFYDNAGTVTAIPGGSNVASIFTLWQIPNGNFRVQYDQAYYSTMLDAEAALADGRTFVTPPGFDIAFVMGWLIVKKSATDLSNTTDAKFITSSRFGQGTSGAATGVSSPLTTKGDLYTYDTGNTRLPVGTNEQVLVADSTQATGLRWSSTLSGLTDVQIGTTTTLPFTGPLTVQGTLQQRIQAYSYGNTTNDNAAIIMGRARGTTSVPTAVQSGDRLGSFLAVGYNGTSWAASTAVTFFSTENYTGVANGGEIRLETTPIGSVTRAAAVTIDSTQVRSMAGTAAVPTYSFSGDVDTGMYSAAANTLGFSTGGTSRLTIDGSGAASLTGTLDVIQQSASAFARLTSYGTINPALIMRFARGTLATPTATQSGDQLLFMGAQGYGTTGFSASSRATLAFRATENWTDTAQGTYFQINLTPAGSTTARNIFLIGPGGDIRVGDGTVSAGTTGQVLISNGGSANSWSSTPTLTGTNFSGIPNGALINSSITVGSTSIALGASATTINGVTQLNLGGGSNRYTGILEVEGNGSTAFASVTRNSNDSTAPALALVKSRGTTFGSLTIVQNGDEMGGLYFQGTDGVANIPGAAVRSFVDGTPGVGQMPSRLAFYTRATADATVQERMRLNTSGALGFAGANFGTSGQVLVSGGSTTTPAWSSSFTGSASLNVLKAGDTMTGQLTVSYASPIVSIASTSGGTNLILGQATAGNGVYTQLRTGSLLRFLHGISNAAESGSDVGSDFFINRYDDAGTLIDTPFIITRSTGVTRINALNVVSNTTPANGLFLPTTNTLAVSTNSTERMRIDSSGNLLINQTTGYAASGFTGNRVQNAAADGTAGYTASIWNASNAGVDLQLLKSRGATIGTRGVVASGDTLGQVVGAGDDGTNFIAAGQMLVAADGTPVTGNVPGRVVFGVTPQGGTIATFTITNGGTGYTDGSYTNVPLTVSTGVGRAVTANLTVAGGIITVATVGSYGGYEFAVGDTLTADATYVGAGTGLVLTVATLTLNTITEKLRLTSRGTIGLGSGTVNERALRITQPLTGASSSYGIYMDGAVRPDVISAAYFFSIPTLTASAQALTSLFHFRANNAALSRTTTAQYGFYADNLNGATSNYGFFSNLAAASGRWNFYANSAAQNYLAGITFIGDSVTGATLGGTGTLQVHKASTTAQITLTRASNDAVGPVIAVGKSRSTTAADPTGPVQTSDTLGTLSFYGADGTAFSAGSVIAAQAGELWSSTARGTGVLLQRVLNTTTTQATFLQASGAGPVSIATHNQGTIVAGGTSGGFRVTAHVTGAATATGTFLSAYPQSDATTSAYALQVSIPTTTASTAYAEFRNIQSTGPTLGAGATLTNYYSLYLQGSTVATNNYALYTNQTAGATNWGIHSAGTAQNYFLGNVGIGSGRTAPTQALDVNGQGLFSGALTSNTSLNVSSTAGIIGTWNSTNANGGYMTWATSGTVIADFGTAQQCFGSGGTDTLAINARGARALVFGSNNVERVRLDSSGNFLVTGAGGLGYGTGSGGAVTQATSRTTGVTLNKTNGAITLFSAAGSTTPTSFTVTNSTVAATDTINICQKSGTDRYLVFVTNVAAGSFEVTFYTTGGTTTEQPVFNFAVLKAVTS